MDFNEANIPQELRRLNQWVCWKQQGDKKLPISATTGVSTDWQNNLASLEVAEAYAKQLGYGIGFAFNGQTEFWGIDLDGCRNPATGELEAWAKTIVDAIPTYWEVSPSGTGLKGICRGHYDGNLKAIHHGPPIYGKVQQAEFRTVSGFFALTGLLWGEQ